MTKHHSSSDTYGRFDMSVHERVLHAKVFGSLDPASMNAATNILVPLVQKMDGPWASLMDYREWELYTEEMIPLLLNLQTWLLKQNHKVEVAVVGKSGLKKNARERLLQELDEKPQQVYVETEEQGWKWLIEHGYCINHP
ncbi:hypothetical protein A3765_17640 [Oleiphilus sp. HI0130]|nr:hypothetical protein A3765_05980 [Oleiphilus sp. HI0130]KZZ69249.1 hypothetical protein A3765_17640 [Oleiphilus sp. HI0130]